MTEARLATRLAHLTTLFPKLGASRYAPTVGNGKIETSALLLALVAFVGGCSQSPSSGAARAQASRLGADESHAAAPTQRTRVGHEVVPFESVRGRGSMHRFRVSLAHAQLSFVDLHYQAPLINSLGQHQLLINGGYWAYQGSAKKIQGLLVVDGAQHAPRANNLSGGVLEIRAGRGRLLASDLPLDPTGATLAIQCSPRLVDKSRVIPKLEHVHLAARTALCLRDDGTTLDAYLTHDDTRTTLSELGTFLVHEGCQAALNLDGGPSTAAAFRDGEKLLTVGLGEALPYGLAFD